ncbi:hypothetical protein JCM3765_003910 [Sporobolomyces pararoseus]
MFRAGQAGGPGKSQAASGPYKPPVAKEISVPKIGGSSQDDRTYYNSSSSQSSWGGNGYRGSGSGGNHFSHNHQSRNSYQRQGVAHVGEGERNRGERGGHNGFPQARGGRPNFETGRGYEEQQDPLEYARPKQQGVTPGADFLGQRARETLRKSKQEKEEKRRNAELAAERRQREEEEKARLREEEDRRDEEKLSTTIAQNREADKQRRAAISASRSSTSTSTTVSRRVTDKYKNKEPVDLAATIAKSQAFLTGVDVEKKVDSDDELVIVTLPASKKDREQAKTKAKLAEGKGKERAKDAGNRSESKKEKKSRLGRIKGGGGFDDEEDDEALRTNSSKACKGGGGPTLAQMYANTKEAEEMDELINQAEEQAKKTKKKEVEEDSDLEIVDPSKSQEEEEEEDDGDEGDWRYTLRDVEREETPDELLMTQRPAKIDPSTLCPFCDQPLPEQPSERLSSLKSYLLARPHIESRHSFRNSKAKYLPIVEIASFCQLHKVEKTVIPEGRAKGYPVKIDWKALPERIEKDVGPLLTEIITGETPSSFLDRAKEDWERNNGFKRTNITAEWDSFHLEEPGYYGPRGFECIHSTLRQLFMVVNPILIDANISPFSPDFYLRRILVPETALELIRHDLGSDRDEAGLEEASKVLEDSRAFGKAAHAIVEDVEKERAKAREEEKRREEAVERERKEAERIEREEQEEAERLEREEEEKRVAAETPQYRQPKTLVKRPQTVISDSFKPTVPSSSSTSSTSTQRRALSPDLNELELVKPKPQSKPSSVANSTPSSFVSQPKIAAFMKTFNIKESDLETKTAKKSSSSSSSSKGKEPVVIDSSSEDEAEELVVDSSPEKSKKKKKRRASSPEKRRHFPSSPVSPKKRRASSPTGQFPTKKRKSKPASISSPKSRRASSPIKDQTNSQVGRTDLEKALADCSSDLESDIETNFGAKNRKLEEEKKKRKKEAANEARKRTLKEKQRQAEIEKEKERRAKKKSKGKGKEKEKEKEKKLSRPRLAADSSDSD